MASKDDYAQRLQALEGNAFQRAVVDSLQRGVPLVQRVRLEPDGDGGLDCISDGFSVGYCCLGLTTDQLKVALEKRKSSAARKEIHDAVVKKFKADLRRVLELDLVHEGLVSKPNSALEGIFGVPPHPQLRELRLVVNLLFDNTLVGELRAAFEDYRKNGGSSRYVSKDCGVVVWGPHDVANHTPVTGLAIALLEHPEALSALKEVRTKAEPLTSNATTEFDSKFDDLASRGTHDLEILNELRERYRLAWEQGVALDDKLSKTSPLLHEALEVIRRTAAQKARLDRLRGGPDCDPFTLIESSENHLLAEISKIPDSGLAHHDSRDVAQMETGRLIGVCPLDWRKK